MDVVRLRVPYDFIRDRIRMSWRDVLFGLEEELLDPAAPTKMAAERLTNEAHASPNLVELAGLSAGEDVRPCVERLASDERDDAVQAIRARWLCIVLAWILEHKDDYGDPLQAVEEVYADFDYPEGIAGFVRYMPSNEPDLGSRELNEARLYRKWQVYVEDCSRKYAPTNSGEAFPGLPPDGQSSDGSHRRTERSGLAQTIGGIMNEHPGLLALPGREMSSAEFVRGYVQLRFDGPCLSAYTMPTIRTESGEAFDASMPGYADALVGLVGKCVEAAIQDEASLQIRFAGGASVTVSLGTSDGRVEEAAILVIDGAPTWSW
jgi:hypothetical protein